MLPLNGGSLHQNELGHSSAIYRVFQKNNQLFCVEFFSFRDTLGINEIGFDPGF
jgi:hypothetical protein